MCALPTPPAVWIRRRRRRRRDRLMMVACVLEILDLDDEEVVVGRTIGSTNIRRTRKKVKDMWKELGCYARKAYRMNMDSLKKLHSLLLPALRDEFDIKERSRGKTPNGNISTLLRLSAAIRFFAGGSVYVRHYVKSRHGETIRIQICLWSCERSECHSRSCIQ